MRVLKTVQSYYPFQDRGGPVFKVRALARSLTHRGHHVSVLTADLGLGRHSWGDLHIERGRWGWRTEEDGVEAIYLPTFGHYRSLTLNPDVLRFCGASLNLYDVVHLYGLYDLLGPAVSYFCRRSAVPYVIEPMGMYRPIDRSFHLKRFWHRTLGKSYIRHAAQIVATSELERVDLIDQGVPAEKIVLRFNGIELDSSATKRPGSFRNKWAIPVDEPLILFLSRLIPRKGADTLIEAFATVCPTRGTLVIAGPEGENGYVAYLKKCAGENCVAKRVIFTGPVYDAEKTAMYFDSDVFVGRVKPDVILEDSRAYFTDGEISSGSSDAAAYVAGVVALLKADAPGLRPGSLLRLARKGPAVSSSVLRGRPSSAVTALGFHFWQTPSRAQLAETVRARP